MNMLSDEGIIYEKASTIARFLGYGSFDIFHEGTYRYRGSDLSINDIFTPLERKDRKDWKKTLMLGKSVYTIVEYNGEDVFRKSQNCWEKSKMEKRKVGNSS